jgi:DNA polymerase-3 subunit delta'
LEDARRRELVERATNPLQPSWNTELRGIYLAVVKTLREFAGKRPATGDRQVFVVGDAEALVSQESSPEAANALLKVLEEPPAGTTLILTASQPERLLPTIRSRTIAVHVPPLATEVVQDFLVSVANVDPDAAARASALSGGSIGQALGYLPEDSELGPMEAVRRDAWRVLQAAGGEKADGPFRTALSRSPSGARMLGPLFDHLGVWIRDLAAVSVGAEEEVINIDAIDALRAETASGADATRLARALDRVEHARVLAQGNVNPQLVLFGLVSELRPLLHPGGTRE